MSQHNRKAKSIYRPARLWWLLGILVALGVAAYINSFDVPFVFDDLVSVQRNGAVRFAEVNWNPLGGRAILYVTFIFNYLLSGQEVWSYHLVNLVFHLLNGLMLFFIAENIFKRIENDQTRSRLYALFASGIFLVHPVQTESVTYISSRSELLSTAFYLAGVLLFVKWPERRIGFLFSILVSLPFLFALGAKETAISLPATLWLYDFIFLSGGELRPMLSRWRFYVTFFVGGIAAAYYLATYTLRDAIGSGLPNNLSSRDYFLTQLRVIVRYVYLLFFPVGLNLDYDFRPSHSLFEPTVIASFLLLAGIAVVAWIIRKRSPVLSFSIFWFFLTLAPTSSVVPIEDVIFEHRLYLPLVGVCLSGPLLFVFISKRLGSAFGLKYQANAYGVVFLALLSIGTIMRNQVWRDDVRLWSDVASKSPYKARPHNALVFSYYKKAQYQQAIDAVRKAMKLIPDPAGFADSLGNMYFRTGQYEAAIEVFKNAIPLTPPDRLAMEYNNLGVAYLWDWQATAGQIQDAVAFANLKQRLLVPAREAFLASLKIDPGLFTALDSYINVSSDLGLRDELEAKALAELESKDDFNNLYMAGKIAFLRGNYSRSDEFFERAEKLKDTEKLLYFNHAYSLDALKQKDGAIAKYLQAIRIDPIFIEAHHNLARIYMERQEYDKAIDHFSEVLRYDPKHIYANLNLAKIYGALGNKSLAKDYLTTVLSSSPGNQTAVEIWQQLGL